MIHIDRGAHPALLLAPAIALSSRATEVGKLAARAGFRVAQGASQPGLRGPAFGSRPRRPLVVVASVALIAGAAAGAVVIGALGADALGLAGPIRSGRALILAQLVGIASVIVLAALGAYGGRQLRGDEQRRMKHDGGGAGNNAQPSDGRGEPPNTGGR